MEPDLATGAAPHWRSSERCYKFGIELVCGRDLPDSLKATGIAHGRFTAAHA